MVHILSDTTRHAGHADILREQLDGRIMVARQTMKVGQRNAGRTVMVTIEDTYFRITLDGEEIAVRERKNPGPLEHIKIVSKH